MARRLFSWKSPVLPCATMACCSQIQGHRRHGRWPRGRDSLGQRAGGLNVLPQQSDAALDPPRARCELVRTVGQRPPECRYFVSDVFVADGRDVTALP